MSDPSAKPLSEATVRDALVAMLDDEGFGYWVNAGDCADEVLALLGIDPATPAADVQRWIHNGPRWDRLLKTAIDLTPGSSHLIGHPAPENTDSPTSRSADV